MSQAYPKPERIESSAYRTFIRTHQCVVPKCYRRTEAHHIVFEGQGRIGSKVSDYQCVPCCTRHHEEYHSTSRERFSVKYSLNLAMVIIELLSLYIRRDEIAEA